MLKWNGKPRFDIADHPDYDQYLNHVVNLFDCAMHELDPCWRSKQYDIELYKVLAIFEELSNGQRRAHDTVRQLTHYDDAPALGSMPSRLCESPISACSSATILTPDSCPFASVGSSFCGSSPSVNGNDIEPWTFDFSTPLSPAGLAVTPPSELNSQSYLDLADGTSPSSPLQNYPVSPLRCGLCGEPFSGKPRDQKSNLRRHINTEHDRKLKFACPEPDCEEAFPRSDYLNNHARKSHPWKINQLTAPRGKQTRIPRRSKTKRHSS
jgi:uncharacterized C2H2 Zn-finger protein